MSAAAADPLAALETLPGVAAAIDRARDACTTLRWHNGLRRHADQARAEAVVRAARASAALDGADLPLERVRELVGTQGNPPNAPGEPDAVERTVRGALRVNATAAELSGVLATAPAQALARLHLAAVGDAASGAEVGRPRAEGVSPRDLVDLGPAPSGAELAARLDALCGLLVRETAASALVVAAVVHGELLALRPFVIGNGLVARAVARAVIVGRGLDPTGVAVPEVGALAAGSAAYVGSALAFASGTSEGMTAWIEQCAAAVEVGAREGALIADAVLAGRLAPR